MIFRIGKRTSEKLALGAMELQLEHELPPMSPALLAQKASTRHEITQCSSEGGRCVGAQARCQVELRELLAFVNCRDQIRTSVELIDDFENRLVLLLRRGSRCYQPPDPQMSFGTLAVGNGCIGCFVHAIVD